MAATGNSKGEKGDGGLATGRRTVLIDSVAPDEEKAEVAKAWLEAVVAKLTDQSGSFDGFALRGIRVERAGGGTMVCGFRVPSHQSDTDGNWAPGAVATLIDNVGAMTIVAAVGMLNVSVALDIAYFAPVKVEEEVEIEGKVLYRVGILTAVTVDVRKKGSAVPVACGRQWMASRQKPKL